MRSHFTCWIEIREGSKNPAVPTALSSMTDFMKGNSRKGKDKNVRKDRRAFHYSQRRVRQLEMLMSRESTTTDKYMKNEESRQSR